METPAQGDQRYVAVTDGRQGDADRSLGPWLAWSTDALVVLEPELVAPA